jgi:astacin
MSLVLTALLLVLLCSFQKDCSLLHAQDSDPYAPYDDGTPDGWMVIEGDILVPAIATESVFATRLWPYGVVPYEFDSNVDPNNEPFMLTAMAVWEAVANVQFVVRNGHSDYIHIQNSTENSSLVGMWGDKQVVNISSWGTMFTMVHELGHALGFYHEQSRWDRNDFVTIEEDRIASVCGPNRDIYCGYNFDMHGGADVYGPYDFNSVMHYGQCAWSKCANCMADPNNCRTITVKPDYSTWQNAIGQRSSLSKLDQLTMSFLYPESDWEFVNKSYSLAPPCSSSTIVTGKFLDPHCEFTDGAWDVPAGGTVIIQPGTYSAVGTYTKAMTLRAPLGGVILGGP